MPVIFGFFLMVLIIYLMVAFIIPMVAIAISTVLVGKTAKLEPEDTILLAFYFYIIQSVLCGIGFIFENDPQAWWSAIFYFLVGFIWPLPYSFMMFGVAPVDAMAIGLLFCSFIIVQLIAVMTILKRAGAETEIID